MDKCQSDIVGQVANGFISYWSHINKTFSFNVNRDNHSYDMEMEYLTLIKTIRPKKRKKNSQQNCHRDLI